MGFYYSLELRKKVLEALSKGYNQNEVSKIFNIGRTTIYRWIKREKDNNLAPTINHNKRPHKLNRDELIEYIYSFTFYLKYIVVLKLCLDLYKNYHNLI